MLADFDQMCVLLCFSCFFFLIFGGRAGGGPQGGRGDQGKGPSTLARPIGAFSRLAPIRERICHQWPREGLRGSVPGVGTRVGGDTATSCIHAGVRAERAERQLCTGYRGLALL